MAEISIGIASDTRAFATGSVSLGVQGRPTASDVA